MSYPVILKLNSQGASQEVSADISAASSPGVTSSPPSALAPSSPVNSQDAQSQHALPTVISSKRKHSSAAGLSLVSKRKRLGTPSSPLLGPSDPSTAAGTPGGLGSHHATHSKLGPKANQGSINAQLRALDRSGHPCRKWTRTTVELKSFTGWEWTISTWTAEPGADQSKSGELPDLSIDESQKSADATIKPESGPVKITIPAFSVPNDTASNSTDLSEDQSKEKDGHESEIGEKRKNSRFPAILLRPSAEDKET
ncbi:INO80 complex subunit Ies4-domain-containing protein [Lipomyces oligophaga]|uniref:INO80 complex subunit Ies4-domain-containing protein n=1 Tax=Lipomyces oligophaga TaxID=45792 RepID=UPI0034CD8FF4